MKKCPTCEKTFDDSMRFCQTDGTELVEDVESSAPVDPYQTIVAPSEPLEPPVEEPAVDPYKTMVAAPGDVPAPDASGDLLQIPETPDPLKTMYVSEDELRQEMAVDEPKEEPIFEIPAGEPEPEQTASDPYAAFSEPEPPAPEPPAFAEPDDGNAPSYGDVSPPASPFSTGDAPPSPFSAFEETPPPADDSGEGETLIAPDAPIPSPFGEPSPPASEPYSPPEYKEPEPAWGGFGEPFAPPAESNQQTPLEWAPPPAPEASWQNQPVGQDTPFQPPQASSGLDQTLPIVSLVAGILSICCFIAPLTGPVALITGFMGMKNANNDPGKYGGKGLAIAGMVIGGLMFLVGVGYWILRILVMVGMMTAFGPNF